MDKSSRRQAYADRTREAIIDSAHRLFCRRRFNGTSIDAIAADAGATKGAVYHHFQDKRAVFRACFERQAHQVSQTLGVAPVGEDDWGTAFNQCRAFLEFVVARAEQTLPLQEVITVLGWAQWREIDTRHTIGHIERVVARLQESGEMRSYPADLVVNMIYGLMVDAAMNLTSQPDPEQAYEDVEGVVRHMLMGLKNTDR